MPFYSNYILKGSSPILQVRKKHHWFYWNYGLDKIETAKQTDRHKWFNYYMPPLRAKQEYYASISRCKSVIKQGSYNRFAPSPWYTITYIVCTFQCKFLGTNVAVEEFHRCVCQDVFLQIPFQAKSLLANPALKILHT